MDNDENKNRLALLSRKRQLLTDILRLTRAQAVNLSENAAPEELDAAADALIALYDDRELMFESLNELNALLADEELPPVPSENAKEAERIAAETSRAAARIIELDKANTPIMERLKTHIKSSLKTINNGKVARRYAESDMHPEIVGNDLSFRA